MTIQSDTPKTQDKEELFPFLLCRDMIMNYSRCNCLNQYATLEKPNSFIFHSGTSFASHRNEVSVFDIERSWVTHTRMRCKSNERFVVDFKMDLFQHIKMQNNSAEAIPASINKCMNRMRSLQNTPTNHFKWQIFFRG